MSEGGRGERGGGHAAPACGRQDGQGLPLGGAGLQARGWQLPAAPQAGLPLSRRVLGHVALSPGAPSSSGVGGFLSQICGKSLERGLGKV